MSTKMPLVAPVYLPGQEPLVPGMTEDDRHQMREMLKYQGYTTMAMESCAFKSVMSGVLGFGLGAFFSLMSASFALDDPVRQTMADQIAMERAKRLEEAAKKEGKAVPGAKPAVTPSPATAPAHATAQASTPAASIKPAPTVATAGAPAAGSAAPQSGILSKLPGSGMFKDVKPPPPQLPEVNTMQSTKQFFVQTGKSMYSSGRGFGKVGALYSGIECLIEGFRAKNDIVNPVVAGLFAGGILARNSGPQAVVGGAVAFAAFSGAIDLLYVSLLTQPPSRSGR